ncbi:hypothetical protein [Arthrobacter sp. D2-10]
MPASVIIVVIVSELLEGGLFTDRSFYKESHGARRRSTGVSNTVRSLQVRGARL